MKICLVIIIIIGFVNAYEEWWHDGITLELNEGNIFEHIGKEKHVFIEFFAPFCIWCQRMGPDLKALAEKYMGENPSREDITIAKVNCEANQNLCFDFQVRAYPELGLFRKGSIDVNAKYYGDRTKDAMSNWIEGIVGIEEKKPEANKEEEKIKSEQPNDKDNQMNQPTVPGDILPDQPQNGDNFDMNKNDDNQPKQDPILELEIKANNFGNEHNDASLAGINGQIIKEEAKADDPFENLNFKQRDVFEKMELKMDELNKKIERLESLLENHVNQFLDLSQYLEGAKSSSKNQEDYEKHLTEIKGLIQNQAEDVKQKNTNNSSSTKTEGSLISETHISLTQALLFITIGTLVGVGITFAFVNFRKLKKKKYLVD